MSLPPLLASRLAKRGLLKSNEVDEPDHKVEEYSAVNEENDDSRDFISKDIDHKEMSDNASDFEEVFVEDYEDSDELHSLMIEEVVDCPNITNPHHQCVEFCRERYGLKKYHPNVKDEINRLRMLKKYPLPKNWKEIADPRSNRCYYWNVDTEQVSWLPPKHPRAYITISGQSSNSTKHLDSVILSTDTVKRAMHITDTEKGPRRITDIEKRAKNTTDTEKRAKHPTDMEKRARHTMTKSDAIACEARPRKAKGLNSSSIDPMDPSSYSDTPRGTWSTGLATKGTAKTGVDDTVTGPLYQMRPYPNPGAVLRINKEVNNNLK